MAPLRSGFALLGALILPYLVSGAAIPFNASDPWNTTALNITSAVNATAWNTTVPTPVFTPASTPIVSATPSVTAEPTESCDKAYWVNHLVFEVTLDEFIEYRDANNLSCISAWAWSSDGCTKAPDTLWDADFHNSCLRHDFGYGGFSTLCTLDSDTRERVDKRFSHDLEAECEKLNWWGKMWCMAAKQTFYDAVRSAGRAFAPECDSDHVKRSR